MYRGRIAPTPSGWLHLGHARTFRTAWERARRAGGRLLYRTEDIDPARCRQSYAAAAMEDLRWWGLDWDEGPDIGGPHAPYVQSQRLDHYREAMALLFAMGCVYPSPPSRREIKEANPPVSPVDGDLIFPPTWRRDPGPLAPDGHAPCNWRFRVPDGTALPFLDGRAGLQSFTAGRDFGDFIVWKKDGFPAYELAVVVDDHLMGITEVVRGADLLLGTARQLLLYQALRWKAPEWYHCPLVMDPATGQRMAKTHRSLALRELRRRGHVPGLSPEDYLREASPE